MNRKINSLEQLEEVAELVPASEEDREIIEEMRINLSKLEYK